MDFTFLGWRKLYRHTRSLMTSSSEPIHRPDEGLLDAGPANATLVGSLLENSPVAPDNTIQENIDSSTHMPVLDIDYSAVMLESSTPGHFHLYLNKAVSWDKYVAVLKAMGDAGLLEPGFVECSIKRGQSFVRMPGVKKGEDLSAEQRAQFAAANAVLDNDPEELTTTPRRRASEQVQADLNNAPLIPAYGGSGSSSIPSFSGGGGGGGRGQSGGRPVARSFRGGDQVINRQRYITDDLIEYLRTQDDILEDDDE